MAMAGSAVGLGNMWRFPYMVGVNGGGAFILVYIVFVALLCLPIFFSEFIIGRRSQSNAIGAYRKLAPGTRWGLAGVMAVVTPIIILSYYIVVGGWSVEYLFKSLTFSFTREGAELSGLFGTFSSSTWGPILAYTLFLLATALIILGGVQKGIERFSKVMMPALFVMVVLMAVRTITLPGAGEGLKYLLKPDFSKIDFSVCAAALGQAFFSLSLGYGIMLTYASYVSKEDNILVAASQTTGMDLLFSLIASCAIMPAVFAFGVDPQAGPGLVFETLPYIFSQMPLGGIFAIIFFFSLLVAALTSSVSLYEVAVAYLVEEKHCSRALAALLVFAFAWVAGLFCSLSFGVLSGATLFGMNIFGLFDFVSSNILMMIGGFCLVIFVGWQMKKEDVWDEFTNGGKLAVNKRIFKYFYFIVKWVAPIAVLIIFVSNFLK